MKNKDRESVFEIQFTVGDTFYAYGFSAILSQRKITGIRKVPSKMPKRRADVMQGQLNNPG